MNFHQLVDGHSWIRNLRPPTRPDSQYVQACVRPQRFSDLAYYLIHSFAPEHELRGIIAAIGASAEITHVVLHNGMVPFILSDVIARVRFSTARRSDWHPR